MIHTYRDPDVLESRDRFFRSALFHCSSWSPWLRSLPAMSLRILRWRRVLPGWFWC
jgi:hypothetical protein